MHDRIFKSKLDAKIKVHESTCLLLEIKNSLGSTHIVVFHIGRKNKFAFNSSLGIFYVSNFVCYVLWKTNFQVLPLIFKS